MANKYQLINEMASETLKEITQNGESWIKFLNTASNNYKYSFNEQVLIYAQKPNATACADIETWNKKLRRWVNKGAKGIALLSMENGRNVLRHVFDISDTHSGINKDFKLWEIKPSYENGIIETLENSFGNLEVKSNLAEAIYSASINLVEDNYQDYLVDLKEVLDGVVEDSVNKVGLDLNTASHSLLEHIAGVSKTVAKNIIVYREENGPFKSRNELKKVKRLGPSAFVQCAGFMRIENGKNPLDNTGVHPESYDICKKMLEILGYSLDDVKNKNISDIDERIENIGLKNLSEKLNVGEVTLKDIILEIKKPGRDPREEDGMKPILRTDVLKIEDIKEGMILKGTVRNVVDFGVFVDIGIKNDGLVHKSQMSNKFVKDPMEICSVGDIIDVKVIGIDLEKQRVSLSMKI